nr:MAG TPA: hypothetical protein [Caudoviricetes sp.]
MSVRSNYIKKLMETKNSFDKQYQEVLAESIKSIIGDNTRDEVRNLLKEDKDEEEDSFEEETVDDTETLNNTEDLDTEEEEELPPGYVSVDDVDDVDNLTSTINNNVWDEIEDCKGEDGEYDCRGMDNDKLLKVLKAMNPEDGIRVVSNDDDQLKIEVDGDLINGKEEFVIDLDDFDEEDFDDEDFEEDEDFEGEELKEGRGPITDDDEIGNYPWDDYEIELDDEEEDDRLDQDELSNLEKTSQKKDKYIDYDNWDDISDFESDLEDDMYESLGYTTEYQKESALEVDNNDEVANPRTTRKLDAGLPKGVERPYGKMVSQISESILEALNELDDEEDFDDDLMFDENGEVEVEKDNEKRDNDYLKDYRKKSSKLDKNLDFDNWDDISDFDDTLDEVASTTQNNSAVRGTSMTHANTNSKGKKFRSSSEGGQRVKPTTRNSYDNETVNESLSKELKRIQQENKAIKEFIPNLQQKLDESMVINSSMGFIVKLLNENTTTQEEKRSITERFTKVNSIKEGKLLYETISKELKEFGKAKTNNIDTLFNSQLSEGEKQKKNLVEKTMYKSNELNETLSFMQRLNAIK